MSEKINSTCIGCGAALPVNADPSKKIVVCAYCSVPNHNPIYDSFAPTKAEKVKDQAVDKKNDSEEPKPQVNHAIKLETSSFATLYTIATIMVGVGLFVYFWFHSQNMWVYLLTALFVVIPAIKDYFVPARWANVAKNATTLSGEKFWVEYNKDGGAEIFGYFISFFYQIWFFYNFFASFIPVLDEADGKQILCGFLAFLFSCVGIWFVDKLVQTIGETLGNMFPKKI